MSKTTMIQKIKCFFGFHTLDLVSSDEYVIKAKDNKSMGEVTLHLFVCKKCKREMIIPGERKMY